DLVAVPGELGAELQVHVPGVKDAGVRLELVPPSLDLADVDDLVARISDGRRNRDVDDRVSDVPVIVRVREVDPAVEDRRLEAKPQLLAPLGFELGVAERSRNEAGLVLIARRRLIELRGVERARLSASGA